jgi:hypothetical protein
MLKRMHSTVTFANVTALLALVCALAGSAYALSAPDSSGVLHGCVSTRTGALRVVRTSGSCHHVRRRAGRLVNPGEFPISWNQQGPRGPQGLPGVEGQPGARGPAGTVDSSQYYTKVQSDGRYQPAGQLSYGNGDNAVDGQVIVAWPELGFEITTAGPASVGNIALNVVNIGSQNINGEAMVHNGPPSNTISAFAFGLSPGQTTATPFSTAGPFVNFSIVRSSTNPTLAADVQCLNVTSGGATRAHCWILGSS